MKWSEVELVEFFFLFGLRLYIPVNNFSVMLGRSHRFLGISITSTFWDVNVSCSRIQHGDPSEDRTPDLSLLSLMLQRRLPTSGVDWSGLEYVVKIILN